MAGNSLFQDPRQQGNTQNPANEDEDLLRALDPDRIVQSANMLGTSAVKNAEAASEIIQNNTSELEAVLPAIETNMEAAFNEMDSALLNLDRIDANPISSAFKSIINPEYDDEVQARRLQRAQTKVQTNQMRLNLMQTHTELRNKAAMAPLESNLMQLEVLQDLQGFRTGQIQQENAKLQQNSARIQLQQLVEEEQLARAPESQVLEAYNQKRPDLIGPNVSMGRLEEQVSRIKQRNADIQKATAAARKNNLEMLGLYKEKISQNMSLPEIQSFLAQARQSGNKKYEVVEGSGVYFTETELATLETQRLEAQSKAQKTSAKLLADWTAFNEQTAFNATAVANAINEGSGDVIVTPDMFSGQNADGQTVTPLSMIMQHPELLSNIQDPEYRNALAEAAKTMQQADMLGRTAQEKTTIMREAQERLTAAKEKYYQSQLDVADDKVKPALRDFQQLGKVRSSSAAIEHVSSFIYDVNAVESSKDEPLSIAYQTFQENVIRELGGTDISDEELEDMSAFEKLSFLQRLGEKDDANVIVRRAISPDKPGAKNPMNVYAAQHVQQILAQTIGQLSKEIPELGQLVVENPGQGGTSSYQFSSAVIGEERAFSQENLINQLLAVEEAIKQKQQDPGAPSAVFDRLVAKVNEILPSYLKGSTLSGYTGTVENASFMRLLSNNKPRTLIEHGLRGFLGATQNLRDRIKEERVANERTARGMMAKPPAKSFPTLGGDSVPQSFDFSINSGRTQ